MGRDKVSLLVDGRPLVARAVEAAAGAGCEPVVLVGGPPASRRALAADLGAGFVADRWPGEGPLGGVLTVLEVGWPGPDGVRAGLQEGEPVVPPASSWLVLAGDLTAIDARAVTAFLAAAEGSGHPAAVGRSGGRIQPSLMWWAASAATAVRQVFEAGERSLTVALDHVGARHVDVAAPTVANANTPDGLR